MKKILVLAMLMTSSLLITTMVSSGALSADFAAIRAVDFFDEDENRWMVERGGPFHGFNRNQKVEPHKSVVKHINAIVKNYISSNLRGKHIENPTQFAKKYAALHKKITKMLSTAAGRKALLSPVFK